MIDRGRCYFSNVPDPFPGTMAANRISEKVHGSVTKMPVWWTETWQITAQTHADFSQVTSPGLGFSEGLLRAGLGLEVQHKGATQTLVLTGDL
jgi:hypothetical protein